MGCIGWSRFGENGIIDYVGIWEGFLFVVGQGMGQFNVCENNVEIQVIEFLEVIKDK